MTNEQATQVTGVDSQRCATEPTLYIVANHEWLPGEIWKVENGIKRMAGIFEDRFMTDVAFHDGKLHYASGKHVKNASQEVVAERNGLVVALCEHDGKLYDATAHPYFGSYVHETISGNKVAGDWLILRLLSHDGRLLMMTPYRIHDVNPECGEPVHRSELSPPTLTAACSHGSNVYVGTEQGCIFRTDLKSPLEKVTWCNEPVTAMCSDGKQVYYATSKDRDKHSVLRSLDNPALKLQFNGRIVAMIAEPQHRAEQNPRNSIDFTLNIV